MSAPGLSDFGFAGLEDLIYEAMLDDDLLQPLADQVAAAMSAPCFGLGWRSPDGRFNSIASHNFGPQAATAYAASAPLDVWAAALATRQAGVVYDIDCLTPPDELLRSAFYSEYLRPILGEGRVTGLCARLDDGPAPGELKLLRGLGDGAFGPAERRRLEAMLPHLRRLVAVRRELSRRDEDGLSWSDLLSLVSAPVMIVGRDGRIIQMNQRAERLIEAQDCLRYSTARGLRAWDGEDDERLRRSFAVACSGSGATVRLRRSGGGRPLVAVVAPTRPGSAASRALLLISDPETPADATRVRSAFGLSSAEAEIAVSLTCGATVEEIAEQRGVAVSTLRGQLKAIFAKAGVTRQAELVAMIASLQHFEPPLDCTAPAKSKLSLDEC